MHRIYRPTTVGLALINAVNRVDHQTVRTDNWVARRVADQAQHTKLGITSEPAINAKLSFKTHKTLQALGIIA